MTNGPQSSMVTIPAQRMNETAMICCHQLPIRLPRDPLQEPSIALLICDFCPQPLIEAKSIDIACIHIACIDMPSEVGAVIHLGNMSQLGHQRRAHSLASHLVRHKHVIKPDTWLSGEG
jgi:hypothetical protein